MQATERLRISEALDLIWQETSDRVARADQAAARLPADSMALLAAWDAASVLGIREGELRQLVDNLLPAVKLSVGRGVEVFRLDLMRKDNAVDETVARIDLSGTEFIAKVVLCDNSGPTFHLRHSVGSLLLLLQFARDHLDTVLLLPGEMRERRIAEFAETLGVTVAHCRELILSFPLIRPFCSVLSTP